ncbi:hypothetical protein PAPHI01_2194 [Pancytospora philotis]|nr:hypothetical protein PAPHI01_2194 [Pancytospora philotis]
MSDDETCQSPRLADARCEARCGNYEAALEIYSEVLEDLNPGALAHSVVLLEYAGCVLESVIQSTCADYQRMLALQDSTAQLNSASKEVEEDIEICWDCLETCRVNFEVVNDGPRLAEVHKLLGDVHELNNKFEDALQEYHTALSYCGDDKSRAGVLECIADSHKSLRQFEKAVDFYEQTLEIYQGMGERDQAEELRMRIMWLKEMGEEPAPQRPEGTDEPKNINHLRR